MNFVITIGVEAGPMVIVCGSIEMLLDRLRERLREPDELIHEVGLWALHAKPGEWLDWDRGWLFAVSQEQPFHVCDESAYKVKH